MANRIEASSDTLMDQASTTARAYFREAVEHIDEEFGTGYARANPILVAAFMKTAASDYGASVIARALEAIADHSER